MTSLSAHSFLQKKIGNPYLLVKRLILLPREYYNILVFPFLNEGREMFFLNHLSVFQRTLFLKACMLSVCKIVADMLRPWKSKLQFS